ncbi:MAG: hypothetical protein P0107_03435 [Nitrosomonas sp.]|nr:hypothetical protein [Nitrosomonas sp.]
MHITAEDIIVEIIDPNGHPLPHGELGEIVVTHLASRDFPFIRYRTGDIGIWMTEHVIAGGDYRCFGRMRGRSTDFVVAQGWYSHTWAGADLYFAGHVRNKSFQNYPGKLEFTRVQIISRQACIRHRSAGSLNRFKPDWVRM